MPTASQQGTNNKRNPVKGRYASHLPDSILDLKFWVNQSAQSFEVNFIDLLEHHNDVAILIPDYLEDEALGLQYILGHKIENYSVWDTDIAPIRVGTDPVWTAYPFDTTYMRGVASAKLEYERHIYVPEGRPGWGISSVVTFRNGLITKEMNIL